MSLRIRVLVTIFVIIFFMLFIIVQTTGFIFYLSLVAVVFVSVMSYTTYKSFSKKSKRIMKKLEELKNSDYRILEEEEEDDEAFRQVLSSLKNITKTLRDTSIVADGISKGNLDVKLEVQNKDDLFALSMNKMLGTLKTQIEVEKSQQWLKDNILELNELLFDDRSLEETTSLVIDFLSKSMDIFTGMFYTYDNKEKLLSLNASYSFFPSTTPDTYRLGEGTIGEVAKSLNHIEHNGIVNIYDKNLDNIGAKAKINTFTYALSYKGNLHGVIELASYSKFSDLEREFLFQTELVIATAVGSVRGKKDVETLLRNTQFLNDEMAQREKAQNSHSIVGITDVQGTITYANEKFIELSGYSEEELLGGNHRIVNSGEYDVAFWTHMYKTVSSGKVWFYPAIKNKAKDGSFYWVDTTIYPFMNEKGKPESYIAIRTDVTQNVLNNRALERSKKEAELAVRAKTEFLASMSHEIRTPMNGVIGMLGLLLNTELSKQQYEHACLAESSATSLLSIINDILDFSKLEAGKADLEHIEFDLIEELSNFSKSISVNIKNEKVEFLLDTLGIESSHIIGDIGRLKQILNNIVGNAVKFTHTGHILLKAETKQIGNEMQLYVDVVDTGIGISNEKMITLFDAFTQADSSTTRKYGGTGLGLSIAKTLVELMGGKIDVKSTLNKGTTFSFHINIKLANGISKKRIIPSTNIQGKSILIVDDNSINIKILEKQLEQWNMKVTSSFSAQEALSICKNKSFDIMITDMCMPIMDGEELGREVKQIISCKNMKMILMTSYGQHNDMNSLHKTGFDAFFVKPTTPSDLLNAINVIVEDGYKNDSILTRDKLGTFKLPKTEWYKDTKILLIEDNVTNQLVAQGILEYFGLATDIVCNGKEAIDKLKACPGIYKLLLMDCQMPILDGFETTRQIRVGQAGSNYKDVKIIAMTANAMGGDKEKCLSVGMNDYLSKPINSSVLNKMLLKYLEQDESFEDEEFDKGIWDKQLALARVMNKEKLFVKIINSFMSENEKNIINLEKSIQGKDFSSILIFSHTIKGSASNIEASNITQLAREIEILAKKESLNNIDVKLSEIKSQSLLLNDVLQDYIEGK